MVNKGVNAFLLVLLCASGVASAVPLPDFMKEKVGEANRV